MGTRFENATAKGLAALRTHCGVSVILTRGAATVIVTALRGNRDATRDDSSGVRLREFDADYLIDAADYDFGAGPVEPALGDQIRDGDRTFEAHGGAGVPCWEWHDRQSLRYRIHCVER